MGRNHRRLFINRIFFCLALVFVAITGEAAGQKVRAWEESVVIPTYKVGPAEVNPVFYNGRAYQGAKGPVYPYPLLDKLTDEKEDMAYRALYIENSYVRIGVLPEIGGRIFEALDKTNHYDFVYRQHVIKPALIGMTGAWISGGVEWNIPHHHRATSFMPVDSSIENNGDGSATIWVGEIELRHRTRWAVGLTLRPGSSVLEVTTRIFNRTPLPHSFLCFANVAVHANENYQVLFPPTTEIATFHGKNQFSFWPISTEVFNNQDYTAGVDVSWWKNHLTPTSFFAFDADEDFFGGYDHGRRAGVVFIGDHHIVPGKKLWTWGTGSEGKTWERILTDEDGPYLELMVGSYSDNQPDYSWMHPYETKVFTQYWYPIRGLGGLKNASRDAACNLEMVSDSVARMAFHTTTRQEGARAVLVLRGDVHFEEVCDIGPGAPFERDVIIPEGIQERDIGIVLYAEGGRELLRFAPVPRKRSPLPKPVEPPPPPEEFKTNEELYLAGLRLEQFHNPALEPEPYYEEALRRDPSDIRVNTALAVLHLKRGMYHEAEAKLRRALARETFNYTRPKSGEVHYYLGVALRGLGREREAEDAFQRAAWSAAWTAASLYQLGELAASEGKFKEAISLLERSIALDSNNFNAVNLRAALMRRAGEVRAAASAARAVINRDPLNFWARNEIRLARSQEEGFPGRGEGYGNSVSFLGDSAPNALELALDYGKCGLWEEAVDILNTWSGAESSTANPLVCYALAYGSAKLGDGKGSDRFLARAVSLPPEYVFPFEFEFAEILRWAMGRNPSDPRAPYYLGNLLFDHQPEKSVPAWELSRALDASFPTVHRNLGLAFATVMNDLPSAIESLEKAVSTDPKDPRLLYELDALREAAGTDPGVRLSCLEKRPGTVAASDNSLLRQIGLLIQTGRPGMAVDLMRNHHFHVWEGGGEVHRFWVEAHLLQGSELLAANKLRAALTSFEGALEYPPNLEVGPPSRGAGSSKVFYFVGRAHESLGDLSESLGAFRKAAAFPSLRSEQSYYKGLALEKLGRNSDALAVFEDLVRFSRERLRSVPAMDFFEKFGERRSARLREARYHFLAGLGLLGKGDVEDAADEFIKALSLDPNLAEARRQLETLRASKSFVGTEKAGNSVSVGHL